MNKYKTVKSVVLLTKENGLCSFFSQYGHVYVKEEDNRIVMSDRKDFLRLKYCNHIDLNGYWIVGINGITKRDLVKEEET